MKKSMILILAIVAVAFMASSAFSWGHGKGGGMGKGCSRMTGNGWQDLTQDQQDQLKALHQKFVDDTLETRTAIKNIHTEMRMIMETSQPDRDRLVSLAEQLEPLSTELGIKRIDFQLETKKIAPDLKMGFGSGRCNRLGKTGSPGNEGCPRFQDNPPAE